MSTPNATEPEQPGDDRVASLVIGNLATGSPGVDRAQPDSSLEGFKATVPDFASVGAVQPTGVRYEERIRAYRGIVFAGNGEHEANAGSGPVAHLPADADIEAGASFRFQRIQTQ